MTSQDKRRIVILGGTAESYMAAWAICQQYGKDRFDVSVLDLGAAEEVGAVSLQTESLPILARFGLNEKTLVENVASTYKLGTQFLNWRETGDEIFQPIGTHGGPMDLVSFQSFAAKKRRRDQSFEYNDYSLGASAAMAGKFIHPQTAPGSILATLLYSVHLDRTGLKAWLKELCEEQGVVTREASLQDATLRVEDGFVAGLETGREGALNVDLLIDCSNVAANPFREAMGIAYESWNRYFPNDSVIGFTQALEQAPGPFTVVAAHEEGLVIKSPAGSTVRGQFFHRSESLGQEQAISFLERVESEFEVDGAARKFEAGIREAAWVGNYVALGRGYGQYEPLDGSSFEGFLVSLNRFFDLFPRTSDCMLEAHEFNRKTRLWYENMRDFNLMRAVALQFSEFDHESIEDLPASFRQKFELFIKTARVAYFEEEPFPEPYRVSSFLNMGFWPESYHPLVERFDFERLEERFEEMKRMIATSVSRMSNHLEYKKKLLASQ